MTHVTLASDTFIVASLKEEFFEAFAVADGDLMRFDINEFRLFQFGKIAGDGFAGRSEPLSDFLSSKRNGKHASLAGFLRTGRLHIQEKFNKAFFHIFKRNLFD